MAFLGAGDGDGSLGADLLIKGQELVAVVVLIGAGLEGLVGLVGVNGDIIFREDGADSFVRRFHGQTVGVIPDLGPHRDITPDLLLVPQGIEEFVVVPGVVEHELLHRVLDVRVHGGVHTQTAVEDHVLGFGVAFQVVGLFQVLGQLGDDRLGEVGVVGADGHVLGLGFALRQGDGLGGGGIIVRLGDVALVEHLIQHVIAALDQIFRVGEGIVAGGILGDGRQHRTFGQGQLAHALSEVGVGAGFHTLDGAGQGHGVQVGFQDGLLAVPVGQTDGAEDLAHLTHIVHFVVVGQVFDQLLFQRGRALLAAQQLLAGQLVEGGGNGTLEVDTDGVIEVLVFDGHHGMLKVFGDIRKADPDGVGVTGQSGVLVPFPGIQDGGLLVLLLFQVQLAFRVGGDLHDIHGQNHRAHTAQHDAHADQAAEETQDHAGDAAVLFVGIFLTAFGGIGRAAGCFRPLGGQMPLLFGVYGDRLLCGFSVYGRCGAGSVTHSWTIPYPEL